ncbi:MAG: sensor histidine kinase [Polaromonas sp.]
MNLDAWHRLSLRRTLLLVLIPGMVLVVGAELLLTWRTAVDAANAAYDRSLFGAIKAMDANISTDSGGLGVELPYRMLEFFELTASGQVYYRVATEDALVEIGNADLPPPLGHLLTGRPEFRDDSYFGEPIRLGSYARLLNRPLAGQTTAQRVIIQVAETLDSRKDFTRTLVLQSVARDLLLVLAATGMLALAVAWALRPLAWLRSEVQARSPEDMTAISARRIPADVQPLVEAINFHIERNRKQTAASQRFVDDASHQLRTPLATLTTQVAFALRETHPERQREALLAIRTQLDETVRQTNQMLALARAESAGLEPELIDACALAEQLTRQWWTEAREHGLDLGFESDDPSLQVRMQPALLKEALSNLLHNAIRYTPRGGEITVRVARDGAQGLITVIDNGPGLPPEELRQAGERFFRGSNVSQSGTGLGLAIARSIVQRHGGELRLDSGMDGRGLAVTLVFPLLDSTA